MEKYNKEWNLSNNQYISHIASEMDLSNGINLIIADVGTGKSVYFAEQPNTYFIAPLISIVSSIKGEDVSTWNAKVKAVLTAEDKSIFKDVTLVVDECHGILIDDYKSALITDLIKTFKYFKSVVLLSGTVKAEYFTSFNIDRVYRIVKKSEAKKEITTYIGKKSKSFLTDQILACDTKAIALINNIDLCEEIKNRYEYNGGRALVVNRDVKDRKDVKEFYESKRMVNDKHHYDLILGTDSIREGLSIEDECEEVTIFIYGHRDPDEIEQFTNRFRRVSKVKNVIYVVPPVLNREVETESTEAVYSDANLAAEHLNNMLSMFITNEAATQFKNTFSSEIVGMNIYYSNLESSFKVNSVNIDFTRAKKRSEKSMYDIVTFNARMKDYDFTIKNYINVDGDTELNQELNESIKLTKDERKKARADLLTKVNDYFEHGICELTPETSEYNSLIENIKRLMTVGLQKNQIPLVVEGYINDGSFIKKIWEDYRNDQRGNSIRKFIIDFIETETMYPVVDGMIHNFDARVLAELAAKEVCKQFFGNDAKAMAKHPEWKSDVYYDMYDKVSVKDNRARTVLNRYINLGKSVRKSVNGKQDRYFAINHLSLTGVTIEYGDVEALRISLNNR